MCSPEQRAACPLQQLILAMQTVCLVSATRLSGRSQGVRFRPTFLYAIMKSPMGKLKLSFPRGHTLCSVPYGYKMTSAKMRRLFNLRSPFAVLRLVISIPINPVYGMLGRWFFAHIREKVNKPILSKPSFTHLYASCPITMIRTILRVITPHNHTAIRVHLKFVICVAPMFVLRIIATVKHTRAETFATADTGHSIPSTRKCDELIATIATYSKPSRSYLFSKGKGAFMIHKNIITDGIFL